MQSGEIREASLKGPLSLRLLLPAYPFNFTFNDERQRPAGFLVVGFVVQPSLSHESRFLTSPPVIRSSAWTGGGGCPSLNRSSYLTRNRSRKFCVIGELNPF